jgi:phenylpropionate dioxygenase-like ring-hydroxylating dioxygenase large terminal subunit
MWASKGRLPFALDPSSYSDAAFHERELAAIFVPAWHCVGAMDDIPREGDYFTTELLGRPVLVRNTGGAPRAFLNVCAHRHILLTSKPCGHFKRIQCQFHGWEYDDDGAVCKVPDARSFLPVARGVERLRRLRAATCQRLVFVSLAPEGPDLKEALGPATWGLIEEGFGPLYHELARWTTDHAANWKVPVEGSVESYHVPVVHPGTFARMPAEEDELHEIGDTYSFHEDSEDARSPIYRAAMRGLRRSPRYSYRHHLSYPSLMLALTDAMSFLRVTLPTSPTTSRSLVRAYAYEGDPGWLPARVTAAASAPVIRSYIERVIAEDEPLFADMQRGLASPDHAGPGVLGAREERVHAFQAWVAKKVG